MRTLRSRECGLYEASDLLLGDHLCEKSHTVQYLPVAMPHKRKRRLKSHSELKELLAANSDSEDIFVDNVISTHYPNRPDSLDEVCLHDFVSEYDYYHMDSAGNRTYRKLTKPKFINHKIYDPNNPEQREDYFYALLLLFVPFRDESSLLNEDETAEEAFERLLPDDDDASTYHSRLQAMLKARNTLKEINQARELDPIEKNEDNEDPEVYGEAKSAMQDLVDINTSGSNDFSLKEREEMLNADQSRIYHKVRNTHASSETT